MITAERTETTPSKLEIVARRPSQFSAVNFYDSQLRLLIKDGYGYSDLESRDRMIEEYGGEDHRRITFLGYKGRKLVGSVAFGLWTPTETKRGVTFWKNLPEPVRERGMNASPLAVDVVGIVISPPYRGRGFGAEILGRSLPRLNPSIVVGETKSPVQAVNRASALARLGYRTFLGHSEITPGKEILFSADHRGLVSAYLAAKGKKLMPGSVLHISTEILPPTIPDVSGFPVIITDAFRSIIEEQTRAKGQYSVVKPLISVRSEVLEVA